MNNQEIAALGQQYVMHTYGRLPIALVKGEGCRVWDADGKEYLDFVGGLAVNSLGHAHPAVAAAICRQAGTMLHCSNLYWIEPQVKLAQLLAENSCADKVFFCNSGAEANEGAIKLARKYAKLNLGPDKYEIITATNSFHGRTLATVTATGQTKYQKGFDPLPQGFRYVPFNDLAALAQSIGPHTCAVMLEPVQGEGGVIPARPDYLAGVAQLCKEKGLLLIFDEVQCGLGRTGKLFAYQHYQVEPDIITLAKALGGGFPVGAMLAKDRVAAAFQPGDHASTFGGNPLACTAALAAVTTIIQDGLPEKANSTGAYLANRLQELARRYSYVKEVRGLGLMLGMELTVEGKEIVARCQEQGLLINCTNGNVLRFLPPLTVSRQEADQAMAILEQAMAAG
ncbi:acetylornithine transaminase [Desulforamulus hydrothermalis]|uniref:Acetylornithine aminotransferase n=1 Tax=Desulforamulus hydrothermalis Lam5 = DSM 18033 TaxID=1121428 RepID=K8DYD7_9FIRM|nr:acetylornithine transaminase [Desulforamulus hydrothermalis]CCO07842.1 Acetylornithine aminotransferase [Desulforamulus hydrothermalis Lam5 = DSM 18033]SHH27487.1 acetylornithine aminotransferase apoenzyme [Desulforamulus hydrothermalis Lam5 = DSM 18033]